MARNGFHAVRTHADTTLENGLRSVEALAEVRRRVADVIDVEIVALCSWPITGTASADQQALLRDAHGAGADLVSGCPHLEEGNAAAFAGPRHRRRPRRGSRLAHRRDARRERRRARRSRRLRDGESGFEVGSDGEPLLRQPRNAVAARRRETAEAVAAAGITVVALPATNLYLLGRGHPQATPRGLTAVRALLDAGVVLAGGDSLQDPFNPLGRGCPFETAALMVLWPPLPCRGVGGSDDRSSRSRSASRPTSSLYARVVAAGRSLWVLTSTGVAKRQQRLQEHVRPGRDVGRVGVSAMLCDKPPTLGVKIIAAGQMRASIWAS